MTKQKSKPSNQASIKIGSELVEVSAPLPAGVTLEQLPPILLGHATPQIQRKVIDFYGGVGQLFELWLRRHEIKSRHTARTYRNGVMSLVNFKGIPWPKQATELLAITVTDVLEWPIPLSYFDPGLLS